MAHPGAGGNTNVNTPDRYDLQHIPSIDENDENTPLTSTPKHISKGRLTFNSPTMRASTGGDITQLSTGSPLRVATESNPQRSNMSSKRPLVSPFGILSATSATSTGFPRRVGVYSPEKPIMESNNGSLAKVKTPTSLAEMPAEVLLKVMDQMGTSDLVNLRSCSSRINYLASMKLDHEMSEELEKVLEAKKTLEKEYVDMRTQMQPLLDHYRGYVKNVNVEYIQDLINRETVEPEVEAVCECLCLLNNIDKSLRVLPREENQTQEELDRMVSDEQPQRLPDGTSTETSQFKSISMVQSKRQSFAGNHPTDVIGAGFENNGTSSTSISAATSIENLAFVVSGGAEETSSDDDNDAVKPESLRSEPINEEGFKLYQVDDEEWAQEGSITTPKFYDWHTIRKWMRRQVFKQWLGNLRIELDAIPSIAFRKVERLLMLDPSITYENLRSVSIPAYRFLIIVAACLQFCIRNEKITKIRTPLVKHARRAAYIRNFKSCVSNSLIDGKPHTPMVENIPSDDIDDNELLLVSEASSSEPEIEHAEELEV